MKNDAAVSLKVVKMLIAEKRASLHEDNNRKLLLQDRAGLPCILFKSMQADLNRPLSPKEQQRIRKVTHEELAHLERRQQELEAQMLNEEMLATAVAVTIVKELSA